MLSRKDKGIYFIISFILIIFVSRLFLQLFPNLNLNVGQYNVHHLYSGAFLLVIMSLFLLFDIVNKITTVLAGIGAGLVIDEIIYLIVTDGSDMAYFLPSSLWGMIILSIFVFGTLGGVYYYGKYKK